MNERLYFFCLSLYRTSTNLIFIFNGLLFISLVKNKILGDDYLVTKFPSEYHNGRLINCVWRSLVKPIKVFFKCKYHWVFLHFFFLFFFWKEISKSPDFLLWLLGQFVSAAIHRKIFGNTTLITSNYGNEWYHENN